MKSITQSEASNKWCPDRKYMEKYTDQFCVHERCMAWSPSVGDTGDMTEPEVREAYKITKHGYCGKYQGCKCK